MAGPFKIIRKPFKDDFNGKTGQNSPKVFHIHIYFEPGTQSEIDAEAVSAAIRSQTYFISSGRVGAIGPHTKTNLEVDIIENDVPRIVAWLQKNGRGLSILVHPRSGDEVKDHLDSAIWIGKPVPFNDAFFTRWKAANDKKGPKLG